MQNKKKSIRKIKYVSSIIKWNTICSFERKKRFLEDFFLSRHRTINSGTVPYSTLLYGRLNHPYLYYSYGTYVHVS